MAINPDEDDSYELDKQVQKMSKTIALKTYKKYGNKTQNKKNFQKILQDKNLNKLNEFVISASETFENR